MTDKKELEKQDTVDDAELDELLDSALEDLTKKTSTAEEKQKSTEVVTSETREENEETEWSDEFVKQAAAHFESSMSQILEGAGVEANVSQLQQNFQRMAEAAAQVMSSPHSIEPTQQSNDFASTISQTLQNLSLGSENLQNPFNEQDIMNMFRDSGAAGNESNAFLPFMQGMMQSLLSKEVLYPSLKDILDRYPAWLDEHREALPISDVERYERQMNLMRDICAELEAEKNDDAENVKRSRFDKVLGLMQQMQDLGQPPAELVGEPLAGGIQFDAQGNPVLPSEFNVNDPNQCVVM